MKIKVNIDDLIAAVQEIKARATKQDNVSIEVNGRNLVLSSFDNNDNKIEAILNDGNNLMAEFRHTERLQTMKDKKRL